MVPLLAGHDMGVAVAVTQMEVVVCVFDKGIDFVGLLLLVSPCVNPGAVSVPDWPMNPPPLLLPLAPEVEPGMAPEPPDPGICDVLETTEGSNVKIYFHQLWSVIHLGKGFSTALVTVHDL